MLNPWRNDADTVPAQACESWPISADWGFKNGSIKEKRAALDSIRKNNIVTEH